MFKILAVNSLTDSYTLSVLYLNDVKTGDAQATFAGMLSSALFFAISFPTSMRALSTERPPSRVLNRRLVYTIIVQTVAHVGALVIERKPPSPPSRSAATATATTPAAKAATPSESSRMSPLAVGKEAIRDLFGGRARSPSLVSDDEEEQTEAIFKKLRPHSKYKFTDVLKMQEKMGARQINKMIGPMAIISRD
jgi:hypothetical protein